MLATAITVSRDVFVPHRVRTSPPEYTGGGRRGLGLALNDRMLLGPQETCSGHMELDQSVIDTYLGGGCLAARHAGLHARSGTPVFENLKAGPWRSIGWSRAATDKLWVSAFSLGTLKERSHMYTSDSGAAVRELASLKFIRWETVAFTAFWLALRLFPRRC